MKYLLTSAGISNDSIRNALVDLLGKPIAEFLQEQPVV
jgi:dipeptidase E